MRKTLFAILLALALVLIPVSTAFAATTATVNVTATPSIVSISNAPATWEVNCVVNPPGDQDSQEHHLLHQPPG